MAENNESKRPSGRKKIEMKRIEKHSRRIVTFSKRRKGLFKKAAELSAMCGAHVAVFVFSPKDRLYTFTHPTADSVIDRFLSQHNNNNPEGSSSSACNQILQSEWEKSIDNMELEELEGYMAAMLEFKKEAYMEQLVDETDIRTMVTREFFPLRPIERPDVNNDYER
ncbi:agamous-like MADS-box protein AGL61 [Quercus lobata]|uniref:MADS-box domain-containing protein n=1 Tax=Quercus lobata TaxID=97700 RepID=A0A7N2M6B2_QUELO|nr:agamous-like MADS-box protein AGL61 [Quercus lobata]